MLGTLRGWPPGRPLGSDQDLNKPGEGARRGSGDPPHQFYAEVGKYVALGSHTCAARLLDWYAIGRQRLHSGHEI